MIYLTYNDLPSGIYKSQVIDVVEYLNQIDSKSNSRLLALISVRNYFRNRKQIKLLAKKAIILPMIPGIHRWKLNFFILQFVNLFLQEEKWMTRGPYATQLALKLKRSNTKYRIIFDARGAYHAELNEYNVTNNKFLNNEISNLEKECLFNSDLILAVSHQLVKYWNQKYKYSSNKHIVIPCTLGKDFINDFPHQSDIIKMRFENGFTKDDIVIVYSGSSSGWQSFPLIESFMSKQMEKDSRIKFLWLSTDVDKTTEFYKRFESRITNKWVANHLVKTFLLLADYGVLIRDESVTNQVASPVKFAEYLSCGLQVIISNNLGDYSQFVSEHQCGFTLSEFVAEPVSFITKVNNHKMAIDHFTKKKYIEHYKKILQL